MRRNVKIYKNDKIINKEITYIPFRYIFAMLLTILEIIAIIAIVIILCINYRYFYLSIIALEVVTVLTIIGSNENPDYKVPWLLFVIILPIIGLMLYLMFHQRKLPKRFFERLNKFNQSLKIDDSKEYKELLENNKLIATDAVLLCKTANAHIYKNTNLTYYKLGEDMYEDILKELKLARKFIFIEYFIIEEGIFWNSILDILKEKAKHNVEVKIVYDDIGCMTRLPGNYYKKLKQYNIHAIPFSKLKGSADGEFNNRSHRKMLIIDGHIAYTGGINLADEYINKKILHGHFKDIGIKIEGNAVNEFTKLFLADFYINIRKDIFVDFNKYYIYNNTKNNINNFVIPFGDGPNPIYEKNVGKLVIMNILNHAKDYVYITTPYLITDNELMKAIENTALRGIDVRIIVPHIPDKKLILAMTRSNYQSLIKAGVKVFEYEPGFIHAKQYISDDIVGMIGTINLDYRSLTHHFENGVWIYNDKVILDIKHDFLDIQKKSIYMNDVVFKDKLFAKIIKAIVRVFSPLL